MATAPRQIVPRRQIVPLHKPAEQADIAGLAPLAHLTYHNGSLLTAAQVVTIFWGNYWKDQSGLINQLNAFFDFILTSSLIDLLAEYNVPGQTIGHGSRIPIPTAPITATEPGGGSGQVSDVQIQQALQGWIANGTIPPKTSNTLYFVYLPPEVVSTFGTVNSCQQICGYHSHINGIFYAVVPFVKCNGCMSGSTNRQPFDSLTKVSSHELCEAITDPAGDGWYDDTSGNEIGDICSLAVQQLGPYIIQREWSNQANSCVLAPPNPVQITASATNSQGDLHILAIDQTKALSQTILTANGTWSFAFGDVQSQTSKVGPNIGPTQYVACANAAPSKSPLPTPEDLHILAIDQNGGLWHTIRVTIAGIETWPFAFGDVQLQTRKVSPNDGIGPTPYVACATNAKGDLHILAIDQNSGLWHTIRTADGAWPFAFGDVQSQTRKVGPNAGIGPTPNVTCAANAKGDLHILAIDQNGGLWHTVRMADGTWPSAFLDVQSQTRKVGPNDGIGPTPYVACAANATGDLHILAIDQNGGLWHTIRTADGTWPFAFADMQSQTRKVGPNDGIGPTPYVACSADAQGDLHILAIDQNSGLWHTMRMADGTWPFAFVRVNPSPYTPIPIPTIVPNVVDLFTSNAKKQLAAAGLRGAFKLPISGLPKGQDGVVETQKPQGSTIAVVNSIVECVVRGGQPV